MVRKIIDFLYRESRSVNQAAFLLGFFAFLSQVLAFLRDRLLAHIFGASLELDLYYAAFRIPDLIFVSVASVVSISVLIPFIVEKEGESREALKKFINSVFSFFSILIVAVSALAFFLIPQISPILFKGFDAVAMEKLIFLSRVLLLSPIFLGFSNLFGSLTQAFNRFAVYALAPLLYNAGIIAGTVFLTSKMGIVGVAVGVIFGALLHLLIQVPFVAFSGFLPKFSLRPDLDSISQVIKISLPRTLTLSMSSFALVFLVAFASLMVEGSISVLSLSNNLQSVPVVLIGVSYSLATFPILSRRFRENDMEAFRRQISNTIRFIIFWTLPLSALFIVLRAQIVRVVLGSGNFGWEDTRLTAAALAIFIASAVFQCLLMIFMRGFYSAGFTRKPFIINLFSTLVILLSSWVLVKIFYAQEGFRYFVGALLRVEDLSGTVVLMLPLAFSIGMATNCVLLWVVLEREFPGFSKGIMKTARDSFGAAIIAGAIAYLGLKILAPVFGTTSLVGIFFQGFVSGLVAIIAAVVVLILLKNVELLEVYRSIHQRFWRAKVIATDPEIV